MSASEEGQKMEAAEEAEKKERKNLRKRKKKLYKDLKEQMEFYFSDANLSKDRFLNQIIKDKKDGFIPLELFKSFNKIKALSTNLEDIKKALQSSEILEVKDDQVRRLTPPTTRENSDDCTIYVEGLPAHADIAWARHLFSDFGTVEYVSLPRFKATNKIKGFAFVEFDKPESAQKALDCFSETKPKEASSLPNTENMEEADRDTKPHDEFEAEPMHDAEENEDLEEEKESKNKSKKRKRSSEDPDEISTKSSKRPKIADDDCGPQAANSGEEGDTQGLETSCKKKKKKKNKKKCVAEDDGEILKLRVISKAEWLKKRNKYLSLQKSVMASVKQSLMLIPLTISEKKKPTSLAFQPGVVLRMTLDKPIEFPDHIKKCLIQQEGIAYVDAPIGASQFHLRFKDPKSCQQMADKVTCFGRPRLLQGAEEEEYWRKIWRDQEDKRNKKKVKVGKVKPHMGRAKIFKRIEEAQSKHTYFKD